MNEPHDGRVFAMPGRWAGSSMVAFGSLMITISLVWMVAGGGVFVDFGSIIAILVGMRVRAGSRRATWWALVIMGYYAVVTAALFAISLLAGFGIGPAAAQQLPRWAVPILLLMACWCAVTVAGLVRYQRELRMCQRLRENLCPDCAYNLTGNTSGVCPECGRSIEAPVGAHPR